MEITNYLSQGLSYKDLEIQDFLYTAPNLVCDIALAMNIRTTEKFIMKILTLTESNQEKEALLLTEIDLLNKLNKHPFKPKALPQYFGYAKEEDGNKPSKKIVYSLVYENLEVNLKKRIKARIAKHEKFPFQFIKKSFNYLINTICFLQNLELCPSMLDSDALFFNLNEKEKILKILDVTTSINLVEFTFLNPNRNTVYLPPELFKAEQVNDLGLLNPYKIVSFSFGIVILELLTLQTPKNSKSFEIDIPLLISEAQARYSDMKDSQEFTNLISLLEKILEINPNKRLDCIELFWENTQSKNSLNCNHLMQHIFIEDGDCSELKIFNELKSKGKNFKFVDVQNQNDEIFGIGEKIINKDFTDKISLQAHLLEVKPLRGVNIRTIKGDLSKDFRFWDELVLGKEMWDLENFPINTVIFQANVHEKLIDDEYKKYYYNVYMKNAIKSLDVCEEGAIKILHQHDRNFMEGVHDENLTPICKIIADNFIKGNMKLENFVLLIQSFNRISETTVLNVQKIIEEINLECLRTLNFGFQLKNFKNQNLLKETFQILDEKITNLGFVPPLTSFIFSVNSWDVQNLFLEGLSNFMIKLRNLKKLDLNLKEITKENQSLQTNFPEALKAVLPGLNSFSLALRSEEKPFLDDESLKKLALSLTSYTPKKLISFSFFFDSGGVIEKTIELLYEIIKDRTFNKVNFCYRGKYAVHELKSSVVQKKFQQVLQKNKPLIKIGAFQFLFCENKK